MFKNIQRVRAIRVHRREADKMSWVEVNQLLDFIADHHLIFLRAQVQL